MAQKILFGLLESVQLCLSFSDFYQRILPTTQRQPADTTFMSGKPLKAKRPSLDGKGSSITGAVSAREDFSGSLAVAGPGDDVVYDDSRLLPIANTSRIMKTALPPNAKISREGESGFFCFSPVFAFVYVLSAMYVTSVCISERVRSKVRQ